MTVRQVHNRKISGFFLIALSLHLPVFLWQAVNSEHAVLPAMLVAILLLSAPMALYFTRSFEDLLPSVIAFTTIGYSALLIHLGSGMIELHFHIFVSLATFIAFGLLSPLITGVVAAAVHHLGFFFFLPKSVFNYEASLSIVLLHAFFVVLEAVPALYIAFQFRKMIMLQDSTLGTLDVVTEELSTSVKTINDSGADLLHHSTTSSSSLQSTTASVEELNSMVQLNTQNAKEAASLADQSRSAAVQGDKQVQELLGSINQISKSSSKIEEIISVIDDLAFQTNLLALNAAVEAARAGEQGKGFAVVAEAVRTLAQKSSTAAKDISNLIKQSVDQVASGVEFAQKSEKALKEIVKSIDKVADLNQQISRASEEQAIGLVQITTAISKIDESAKSHTKVSSDITEMTDKIYEQSERMRKLLSDVNSQIGVTELSPEYSKRLAS